MVVRRLFLQRPGWAIWRAGRSGVCPNCLMGKLVEASSSHFGKLLAIVDIGRPGGPSVLGRGISQSSWQSLVCSFLDQPGKIIVWNYDARFVVDIESKIHVWEVFHKSLHHPRRSFLLPVCRPGCIHYLSISNQDAHQRIFEPYRLPCPIADCRRRNPPEGER